MRQISWVFFGLAVWGAVHPMYYFTSSMVQNEGGLGALISAFFSTQASAGLAWDLTVAAIALVVWIVFEAFQRRNFSGLISIPLILFIRLGCGLPFYFFMRLRMRKDIE